MKKQKITNINKDTAKCGNCGKENYVFSERCDHCGIEFKHSDLAECSVCNNLVPLSATECTECGALFEEKELDTETSEDDLQRTVDREHIIGKKAKILLTDIEKTEKREALIRTREQELALREAVMEEEKKRIEKELKEKYSKEIQNELDEIHQKERAIGEKEEQLNEMEKEIETKVENKIRGKEEQLRKMMREVEIREKLLKEAQQSREGKSLKKKEGERDDFTEGLLKKKEEEINRLTEEIICQKEEIESIKKPLRYKEDELNRREKDLRYREEMLKTETERLLQEKMQTGSDKESKKERELKDRLRLLREEVKNKEEELKEREEYLKTKEEELNIMQQRIIDEEIGKKRGEKEAELKKNKISTGTPRLDDLLLGGIPPGSNVFIYGSTFIGKEILLNVFIADGLKKGVPAIFVTADKTPTSIRHEMTVILPNYTDYEKAGLVRYVDIYSKRMEIKDSNNGYINLVEYGETGIVKPSVEKTEHELKELQRSKEETETSAEAFTEYIYSIKNIDSIIQAIINAQKSVKKHGYYRMAFPLSTLSVYIDRVTMFRFLQRICNEVKIDKSVAFYPLNSDMLLDASVQTLKHPMDGVIEFKSENQRTFLCVQGLCDVQSRAWIQYTYTEKGLALGSFSLTRIR